MDNPIRDLDIHSTKRSPKGDGFIYEFWLDTEDDIAKLPAPDRGVASTSIAFIKSTGRVLALGNSGWSDI